MSRVIPPSVGKETENLIVLIVIAALEGSRDMMIYEKMIGYLEERGLLDDVADIPTCGNPSAEKALWFDFEEKGTRHCGWVFFDRALRYLEVQEISPSNRQIA